MTMNEQRSEQRRKVEKLFDDMVAASDGVRRQLPEKIDPSLLKQGNRNSKRIEFVCVPNDPKKNLSDCWVCVSHQRGSQDYIIYSTKDALGQPKNTSLHRVIYQLWMGKELPRHLFACHQCDVPFCINPAHIFPGTAKDNTDDRLAKHRTIREKLSLKDVWDIRLRHRLGGEKQVDLSLEYDVSQETICNLMNFKTWKGR